MNDRATRLHRALDRIFDEGALSGLSKGVGSAAQGAGSAVRGAGEGVGGVASGVGSAAKGAGHAIGRLLSGGEDRIPKPVALPDGAVAVTDRHRRLHAALDAVCDRLGITGDGTSEGVRKAWQTRKRGHQSGKTARPYNLAGKSLTPEAKQNKEFRERVRGPASGKAVINRFGPHRQTSSQLKFARKGAPAGARGEANRPAVKKSGVTKEPSFAERAAERVKQAQGSTGFNGVSPADIFKAQFGSSPRRDKGNGRW